MPPDELRLSLEQFLRLYPMRTPRIMWLLGAGASASAGVKTAYHMIWEFKRSIYCSRQRVPLTACSDLSDPVVRQRIQSYFDSDTQAPAAGADEEYGYFFEAAWPNEADRAKYIQQLVQSATPAFGHLALAALLKLDKVRCIWTTNFDAVVEDAVARVFKGTSRLTTATLDSADLAIQALNDQRWPLLVKLHGDFRSRHLKNTSEELQNQNEKLQNALCQSVQTGGLAVVGYSGRDLSVMTALRNALANGKGYPSGLFWFHRPNGVSDSVVDLVRSARSLGIESHLVETETFDELMADVFCLLPDVPDDVRRFLDDKPRRLTIAPVPQKTGSYPVLRFNAHPVLHFPSVCRRVACEIGGAKDVREAVEATGLPILATRRSVGVIAFGEDTDIRQCFSRHNITEFDLHSIEFHRLRYDSAEHGLLTDAIWRAIARERPVLAAARGRGRWITVDPQHVADPAYTAMKTVVPVACGKLRAGTIPWREAVKLRLVGMGDDLWVVLEPSVWFDLADQHPDSEDENPLPPEAREFTREKAAKRYNRAWNGLFDAWASLLFGDERSILVRALGTQAGVDAEFSIGKTSAFSWRGQST